jgi:spermidine synthase
MLCRDELHACIKLQIRATRPRNASKRPGESSDCAAEICRPFIDETRFYKSLHFSALAAQSRMLKQEPDRLVLDYTRTMMAFLLFNSRPDRIAMIGLGGGSLAKFCYRELPGARIDVVEINPHVVALREAFHVPPDDERFQVHLDDGARFISQSPGRFDVLLIDAYTRDGIPGQLGSMEFYAACRDALCDAGVMVLNLYCRDADAHIDRIRRSFGESVFSVDEADGTNRVVIACRDGIARQRSSLLQRRPAHIRPAAWSTLQSAFLRTKAAMQTPGAGRGTHASRQASPRLAHSWNGDRQCDTTSSSESP